MFQIRLETWTRLTSNTLWLRAQDPRTSSPPSRRTRSMGTTQFLRIMEEFPSLPADPSNLSRMIIYCRNWNNKKSWRNCPRKINWNIKLKPRGTMAIFSRFQGGSETLPISMMKPSNLLFRGKGNKKLEPKQMRKRWLDGAWKTWLTPTQWRAICLIISK